MFAKYLYSESTCSCYVDCAIIKTDVPYTKEYWSRLELLMNNAWGRVPEDASKIGHVISFKIDGETKTQWVECDRVEFPNISEWIGL
jgi:hypothetical protein